MLDNLLVQDDISQRITWIDVRIGLMVQPISGEFHQKARTFFWDRLQIIIQYIYLLVFVKDNEKCYG
jgi:hypothetical protein